MEKCINVNTEHDHSSIVSFDQCFPGNSLWCILPALAEWQLFCSLAPENSQGNIYRNVRHSRGSYVRSDPRYLRVSPCCLAAIPILPDFQLPRVGQKVEQPNQPNLGSGVMNHPVENRGWDSV